MATVSEIKIPPFEFGGENSYTFPIDGFDVVIMVKALDNPPPWKQDANKHGFVSEWTNREPLTGEKVLYALDTFEKSSAKRGKLIYDWMQSRTVRFRSDSETHRDFKRVRAWCRGEWFYVCITINIRADQKLINHDTHWYIPNDDERGINAACQALTWNSIKTAKESLWNVLVGDEEKEKI